MAQLVGIGGAELGHAHVPGVERGHQPLDAAALARGVPPLEDDADRWAQAPVAELTAVEEAQVEKTALDGGQLLGLLLGREAEREVDAGQPVLGVGHNPY